MMRTRFGLGPLPASRPGVGRNLRTASDFTAFPALLAVFGCLFDVFFFDWLMSLKNIAQRMRGTPREQIAESALEKGKMKNGTRPRGLAFDANAFPKSEVVFDFLGR